MSLSDVALERIGDQSKAIVGPAGAGTEASVYARVLSIVIRVSVMSVGSDPIEDAAAITRGIVGRLTS
jgi:hypothetical protein